MVIVRKFIEVRDIVGGGLGFRLGWGNSTSFAFYLLFSLFFRDVVGTV